eukprot:CAMPEP_0195596878 /NCGR_PEP_ID=MMETSP0815-20121206/2691_1 /TAXON_ID=97485 /ORGANISM="Prymnesium parvum, Strain Texoma1" /LENGTH=152 /DNA_ID=CAMNT_0040736191 /DNA_START=139 /DNA_END=598 /DNA_ORIENTATION=+
MSPSQLHSVEVAVKASHFALAPSQHELKKSGTDGSCATNDVALCLHRNRWLVKASTNDEPTIIAHCTAQPVVVNRLDFPSLSCAGALPKCGAKRHATSAAATPGSPEATRIFTLILSFGSCKESPTKSSSPSCTLFSSARARASRPMSLAAV